MFTGNIAILLGAPENWSEGAVPETVRHLAEESWLRREIMRQDEHEGPWLWAPVIGVHAPLGVIGVALPRAIRKDTADEFLLSAAARQLAAALDRTQLANAVRQTELEAQAERLRSSLLSAVSHDLKTPLSSMIAAATTLLGREQNAPGSSSRELLSTIVDEGERLNRLIRNLLSITRLESEGLELQKTPEAVEEIISSAVDRFRPNPGSPGISVRIQPDLPLVKGEPLLLEQVLVNLVDNARRYAGTNANILVQASAVNDNIVISVADDGPGIAEDEREKVSRTSVCRTWRPSRSRRKSGRSTSFRSLCSPRVKASRSRSGRSTAAPTIT